jgi:DNA-binding transcriptional LysR family regulator
MDLRQLRHATVLAQMGSFVRAAEELSITQPALSRSIRSLEEEVGVRLFERGRQGARPTREGKLLIERAEQVRLTLGGLRHDIDLLKKGHLGEVGFGLGPMVAAVFLADLLTELINSYPRLEVRSYVENVDHLRDSLLAEHIDFFVHSAGQFAADPRIDSAPLGELPLSLFVRAGHPLIRKRNLTRADLSGFPLTTGNTSKLLQSTPGNLPARLRADFSCDDFLTLKRVVQRSDAIFLTSRAVVAEECRRGKIVELKQVRLGSMSPTNIVVTSLAGRNLSPTAALVIKILRDLFRHVQSSVTSDRS